MELFNQAFTKEYLIIYEYFLYSILYFFSRHILHKLISTLFGFLLIFYIFVGRHFNYDVTDFIVSIIFVLFLIIYFIKIKPIKIDREKLSLWPIFMVFLFIISYVAGIKAIDLQLPWFTGYLLGVIVFIIGIVIYWVQSKK